MRNRHSSLACGVALLGLLVCCTSVTDDGKAWSPAEQIDEASDPWNPTVALDASGTAIVAWTDAGFLPGRVLSKHHMPDSGWSALEQLDRNEEDLGKPTLAVGPDGDAVVVWEQVASSIWSNRYTVGSGWETAASLDNGDGGHATDPHIAIDLNGNAIAVWHQSDGLRENIWSNRSTPDGGWDTAELIETDDYGHAGDPRVAMDPEGNAIAVWHQSDGLRANILANWFRPDDGWGTARRIEMDDAGEGRLPDVAMDSSGNAIVVWHQSNGTRFDIWSNRLSTNGALSAAERIETNDEGDATDARVGIDADGHAIAVWKQFDGITVDIWSNRYTPGVGWGTARRIERNDQGDALSPRVAVSANGDAVAVWPQFDGSRYDVWSNAYTPGGGWGTAERIDPRNQGLGQPVRVEVAIDANGNALAVWRRSEDPTGLFPAYQLWAARFE